MQTPDVLTGLDIVHHGEEDPADGVAQRNGVSDAPTVDANWKLDVWFNVNEVLNVYGHRVGRVLQRFHTDGQDGRPPRPWRVERRFWCQGRS